MVHHALRGIDFPAGKYGAPENNLIFPVPLSAYTVVTTQLFSLDLQVKIKCVTIHRVTIHRPRVSIFYVWAEEFFRVISH